MTGSLLQEAAGTHACHVTDQVTLLSPGRSKNRTAFLHILQCTEASLWDMHTQKRTTQSPL